MRIAEMIKTYQFITEENKFSLNKPHDNNVIYYSELNNWFTSNAFRAFSLKYVLEGTICYRTSENAYSVNQDQILIASKQDSVKAFFESKSKTSSVCIDISSSIIDEVFSFRTAKYDSEFESLSNGLFREHDFVEKLYDLSAFKGHELLKQISGNILKGKEDVIINEELFFDLAERIVCNEFENHISNFELPFIKFSTRQEVFKRLTKGKEFIDENFLSIKAIGEISNYCFMSKYHFIRTFKQVYKVTPYQYLFAKRLNHAASMLSTRNRDITNIAIVCGFKDIASFSKAFKKRYQTPPSKYQDSRYEI